MKKILCLLLVIVCGLMLWSCTMLQTGTQTQTCTVHTDNNKDLRCDTCGTKLNCTKHVDANENLKCDLCGEEIDCDHADDDNDGNCDTAGCDYVFCEHEYDDEYSYDDEYHYFEPICGCDIQPIDKEKHADADNDGECDVCEWDYDHKHTYATEWSHDASNHWYEVTCTHDIDAKDFAPHADANNDGKCDGCGWDYDHEHTYSDEWSHDQTDHWYAPSCDHDIELKDKAAHADENNDGICDGCAWNYDHEHEYDMETWSTDEENHWHAATCKHDVPGVNTAAHEDADDDGLCDECKYVVCDNHVMDMDKWEWNETTHWHPSKCGHSDAAMEAAGHSFDEDGNYLCSTCGFQHEHTYAEEWSHDKDNHWHDSTCDSGVHDPIIDEAIPHTDENNDGVCEVCLFQFCEHTYAEEWSHDSDSHWYAVTCGHDVEVKDKAAHTDEDNNAICEGCGWDYDHTHTYADTWEHDTEQHWGTVTCGHNVETKAPHADENNDGLCDTCSWNYDHEHAYADEWSYNTTDHWYAVTCTHDVEGKDKAAHVDENNDGVCEVCLYQFCQHTYAEEWSHDSDSHWLAVTCGHDVEVKDKAAHTDEDNNGVCEGCAWDYDHTHTYADEWSYDTTDHWHAVTCTHTIDVADKAAHVDENNDGVCEVCLYQFCQHTYAEEWSYSATEHWHAVTCGHDVEVKDKAAHTDVDINEKCDVCEHYYSSPDTDDGEINEGDAIVTQEHVITPTTSTEEEEETV